MSKKILFPLFITSFLYSQELTFAERANTSFLLGVQKGINGMVETQRKQSGTIDQFEQEEKKRQETGKKRELKRLKKSVKTLSAERYKYIHLYSEEKDKNRELKKRVAKLEKLIAQYHIEEDNKVSARAKAKEDLRKQLRGNHD